MSVRIKTGATEPIEVLIVDNIGVPLTGLTDIKIRVRRRSDDFFFDWADNTFKTGGSVIQTLQVLAEVDGANAPGKYKLDSTPHIDGLNTAAINNPVDDDTYFVTAVQDGGSDATNVPQVGEIKVGQHVDDILDALDTLDGNTNRYQVYQSYSLDFVGDTFVGNIWVEHNNLISANVSNASVTVYDESGTSLFTESDITPDAQGIFKVSRTNPGFVTLKSYYTVATVTVTGIGSVSSAKGLFTIG